LASLLLVSVDLGGTVDPGCFTGFLNPRSLFFSFSSSLTVPKVEDFVHEDLGGPFVVEVGFLDLIGLMSALVASLSRPREDLGLGGWDSVDSLLHRLGPTLLGRAFGIELIGFLVSFCAIPEIRPLSLDPRPFEGSCFPVDTTFGLEVAPSAFSEDSESTDLVFLSNGGAGV